MSDIPFATELFDVLVCPADRRPLWWTGEQLVCSDAACRRAYRVEKGVPVMLLDEAQVSDPQAWDALAAQDLPVSGGGEG